jgi:hypothetical protein
MVAIGFYGLIVDRLGAIATKISIMMIIEAVMYGLSA